MYRPCSFREKFGIVPILCHFLKMLSEKGERRREQLLGLAGAEHLVCTCPVCSSMLMNDGLISVSGCQGTSMQARTSQSLGEGSTVLLVYEAIQ